MKAVAPLFLVLALSAQPAASQSAGVPQPASNHIDTVDVTAPKLPLDQTIRNFVKSYAAPSVLANKIPKWASGICPITEGLAPDLNAGVTAYLKLIAAQVGAPVDKKEPCPKANVAIVFTRTPQAVLDDILKNHTDFLGYHEDSQLKSAATMNHPIQAWYATSTRDYDGFLHLDVPPSGACEGATMEFLDFPPPGTSVADLFGRVSELCGTPAVSGRRANDGLRSEFSRVTIIVDFNKVSQLGVRPVANYIAMLALSQTQAFDTCQPLLSITNLLTTGCDAALKSDELSINDIAYLKALYKIDPDMMLGIQQSSIADQMKTELGGH